eukprot:TRINITY_DN4705_c2_g1_i1.p1 TRINITY_DN4705_c2_g1~~TRINITY_DN4705_c2_g1_i1.p1  ORF type:complete len:106 (+),score=5.19 TRINITY_DN4705_c2_g1_i1:266-583(+)
MTWVCIESDDSFFPQPGIRIFGGKTSTTKVCCVTSISEYICVFSLSPAFVFAPVCVFPFPLFVFVLVLISVFSWVDDSMTSVGKTRLGFFTSFTIFCFTGSLFFL